MSSLEHQKAEIEGLNMVFKINSTERSLVFVKREWKFQKESKHRRSFKILSFVEGFQVKKAQNEIKFWV